MATLRIQFQIETLSTNISGFQPANLQDSASLKVSKFCVCICLHCHQRPKGARAIRDSLDKTLNALESLLLSLGHNE